MIATSLQRCILISLRDFKSKPQLGYMELLNNEGFTRFFKPETNEIVAIRSGKITNHGTIQEILVLDSSGNFIYITIICFQQLLLLMSIRKIIQTIYPG